KYGVTKSLLGEITNSTNKTRAFSMFGLAWGIGYIRPTIDGYLSHPADHFSSIFDNAFWRYYPYLLLCLVASLVSFIGLVCEYFMLPETRNIVQKSEYKPESELLLYTKHNNCSNDVGSYGISSLNDNRETHITNNNSTLSTDNWKFHLLHNISSAIPPLISYEMLALSIIYNEVYIIYTVTRVSNNGLGYRSQDLALSLAIMDFVTLFCHFIILPSLNKRVDTK
ncbi:11454_t:CDS:2, partial [Ambispora gerdemannii]